MSATPHSTLANPEQLIADLRRERDEALAREAAITEVLQIINSSPGDLGPVFEAILDKALRLCCASVGSLWSFDGDLLHPQLFRGTSAALTEFYRQPYRPPEGGWSQRALAGAPFVYVPDITADEGYGKRATATALADLGGLRSNLLVPLRKEGAAIGMISICAATPPSPKPPNPRRFSTSCANIMARWGRWSASLRAHSTSSRATGSWCSSTIRCLVWTRRSARSRWRWRWRCARPPGR